MEQKHAPKIIDALPPNVLQDTLGMTDRAIRHAKSTGMFAAFWYRDVKEICERHGIFCPMEAFYWKGHAKKDGMPDLENQGVGE